MKFATYWYFSAISIIALVYYAYYTQRQFYPTVLFLVSSKLSYVIVGNMVLASTLSISRVFKNLYFGQLRDVEIELLIEKGKYIFIETCFALTIFRNELTSPVVALFGALVFVKLLHKLSKCRLEYMEQIMPVSIFSQIRIAALLGSLIFLDLSGAYFSLMYILKNGRSVLILFGFEFGLQLIYAVNLTIRFAIQIVDSQLANGLISRGLYLMLTDLVCEVVKLATYIAFFCLVFVYYGMPIHIMRDVYAAYMSFHRKLISFIKYLRLTRNLDSRFPDASPEDIAASGGTCLVCREDMTAGKKLPCAHVFHLDCLRAWLQHQQACPLCRAEIPVGPVVAPAAAVPVAVADANQPHAAPAGGLGEVEDAVNPHAPNAAAPLLPQDIHTPAVGAAITSVSHAGVRQPPSIGGKSNDLSQVFPAFFVVTAGPDMAVLSDPSRLGREVRRVSKGTVVFITLRVTEQDGTQWLRGPDGWLLEKMVLCGQCCTADNLCCHDKYFVVSISSTQPQQQPSGDAQQEPAVEFQVDIGKLSLQDASPAAVPGQNVSPPSSSSAQSPLITGDLPVVYSRRHLPDRYFSSCTGGSDSSSGPATRPPFSADLTASAGEDLAAAQALLSGMESSLRATTNEIVTRSVSSSSVPAVGGDVCGGDDARLLRMLEVQREMEAVTRRLVELSQTVLSCQQCISQLIRDELATTRDRSAVASSASQSTA